MGGSVLGWSQTKWKEGVCEHKDEEKILQCISWLACEEWVLVSLW